MNKLLSKMDKQLLFMTILMFSFGLVMILSASSVKAAVAGNPYSVFLKQASSLLICIVASFFVLKMPTKNYKQFSSLAIYFIIGALLFVFSYGTLVNSARSWIDLGFYNFQPSEFSKTILIVYFGVYYYKNKDSTSYLVVFKPLIFAIVICYLTFAQPDFGTMCIIFIIVAMLFFAIPIDKKFKRQSVQLITGAVVVILLGFIISGHNPFTSGQIKRLQFLQPCQRYTESTGYQVCNGFIAINNGGLTGVGLGNSTQKYLYLPEAYTDFIFPVIVEELGLIVGIVIILIYAYIIIRIIRIARRSYNLMGSIIAYGVAVYVGAHVIVNLVGVLGILPLTGVPLPFLSYGGSYALNLSVCLTIVQRIEIENKKHIQLSTLKEGNL
ncbi:MAG: FtsW/RodA/SpoVE family cell cycle protein [Bacilli bacterium]|nr:FtsW/RodA/SpoVE family cell cycle protein [Bacilli bacterium]